MSWLRFVRRAYWDSERSREIASYLEIETVENVARGMEPSEAASAALRKFGNPGLIKEEIYRMNTVSWLESLAQDVRFGCRLLAANPGFAAVAVLSLALGIGANTAIFQLVDAVRLRSLPVQRPGELVEIKIAGGNRGLGLNEPYGELTRPIWEEIRRNHPAFSGVFAWSRDRMSIGEGSDFQLASGIVVSGDFFNVLGIEPYRGRLILPEDEHACPESIAVVSDAYWRGKMGSRALGRNTTLVIGGELRRIVGIAPPSFFGLVVGERFDVALPFCQPKELSRDVFDVTVMGRLRPGETLAHASARMSAASPAIMAATAISGYDASAVKRYRDFRLGAYPASAGVSNLRNDYKSSLWLLLAITGLVLLIACANLANLMLARVSAREREIAVRLALGAARLRLLRQFLVESSLLAGIGAGLGVALASLLSRVLVLALSTQDDTVTLPTGLDWRVLLFAAGVAAITCIVFGVAPALRASGADPITAMKSGGRSVTGSRERFSVQRLMVVTQISVSLVLLVGALLFVRSFYNLMTFNPGMRESGIVLAFIGFQKSGIPQERIEEVKRQVLNDISSVPGVLSAATTTTVPLGGGSWTHTIDIGSAQGDSKFTWVSPRYFETMDIPLLSGRNLSESDTVSSQRVAVVNQTFTQRFLHGANPIGRALRTHQEPGYPSTLYQIVGVIPDTKYDSLRGVTPPIAFAPASQFPAPRPWTAIMIHSSLAPSTVIDSVKNRMAQLHPEMIVQSKVFETQIRDGLVRERLMAMLSGFFGIVAALLAMIGLYGVISYVVTTRRNEIGIRVALGANRNQVLSLVMREAGRLLIFGVSIGTSLSLIAGRGASSLLFGLQSYDLLTLSAAVLLLTAIGAGASFLPAYRASRLEAMSALRCD